MTSRPRLHAALPLPATLLLATALVGGCGDRGPQGEAAFPIELRVTGGQLGRDDRATVEADGQVTAEVRPVGDGAPASVPVFCVMEAAVLDQLAEAAADDLDLEATSPVPEDVADGENVVVAGPGGRAYDVGEGGSDVTVLARRILNDLTLPDGERTLCRPSPGQSLPAGSPSAEATARTVVLTRTGGLAGHDDRVEVAADGSVTGTTKAGAVSCRVAADLAGTLATGAAPSPAGPAAGTDRMTVTLTRGGTSIPLGEAQGGDPVSEAARTLLDDVQQPADARTVCR